MECTRKGKFWRGCKFEPRYDRLFPPTLESLPGYPPALEALKEQVYVCDVCTRCGETIKRGGNE